ncbi:hypothetical protein R1sor_021324 [Riccia sorocarpa]|uniref:Ubiquitin-like protease family profile domain-containing protein n=1 Tax=Riccia sorocarpa TaxID=122646 RepID=A0ABD3GHI5_9MARC
MEKKKKEETLQKEAEEKKKKKKDKKKIATNDDDVEDDPEDDTEEEEEEQTQLRPVVVAEDPRLAPESSKKKRKVIGVVFPQNQLTKRPHFPEIDDVWIAPPISSGMTVDSKGKSIVNEEEEHNPAPEVPKETLDKPSGSGQRALPYGDLPAKFEKFCSQFDSQRSENIPDMFSDPESVQKIQFATSLLADVCSMQAVNTDKYNSQYSQPVDLASSSQTDREKIDRLEQRCLEAEQKLETLKQNHTVLCARKDMVVYPDNIDAYIANPDLVPELTDTRNAFEQTFNSTEKEDCSGCKQRIGFLPTMQPGSCACRYHFHCLWKYACTSSCCSNCGISFLPMMYQFFSNEFTGHVEKPCQTRDQLANTTITGGLEAEKEENMEPASKSTSAVSKTEAIRVTNQISSTPEKVGVVEVKRTLFGGVSGESSPMKMLMKMEKLSTPQMISPTLPPLKPPSVFPESLLPDSQAHFIDSELQPLDLPVSSSNNNSVLPSDTEFATDFMQRNSLLPPIKDENIQGVVLEAPAIQSPDLQVLKSTRGNIVIVSPEKSAEKAVAKKRELEELVAEESPDSAEWDNDVHQKLIKHQKGLLPEIENVADIRYIVVPIHGEYHWSVVLIHINATDNACVNYHMDSIKTYHNHAQIGALLNTWLERGLELDMKTTIVATGITQQTNNFDCGVHVLYIITKMIEAEKDGKLLEYLEKGRLSVEWGTAEIVANYRQEVRDLFTSLVESDT